jgi:glutamyl-tRNA synthetase
LFYPDQSASFVSDFWDLSHFFFNAPTSYNEKAAKKAWKENTDALMTELVTVIQKTEADSAETLRASIKEWITFKDIGFGKVMMPLRLALVGALQGPDVFDIMFMIGKDEAVKRIEIAINSF